MARKLETLPVARWLSAALGLALLAAPVLAQDKGPDKGEKAAPPPPPAVLGAEVITLPGEARGDAASQLQDLLKAISERPDAPGSVLAVDTLQGLWGLVPGGRKQAREVLEKVAGSSPACKNGWALEQYRAWLEELRLSDGDRKGAQEIAESRGYLRQWQVVGPFGHSGRAILHEIFQPEVDARLKGMDAKAHYTTTKGELGWTKVPVRISTPTVGFAKSVRATNGSCYLVAHLESPSERDVTFAYEGGAAKLFLNRALLGTVDRHRKRLDSHVRIDGHLHKGWNRLVLKTGEWSSAFSLRLAGRDGASLPDVKAEETGAFHEVDADADSEADVRSSWAIESLEKGDAEKTDLARQALLAWALANTSRGEEAFTILEKLGAYPSAEKKDKAPESGLTKTAWFWVLAAEVAEQADHLPDPQRRVEAKKAYKQALALDPAHAGARRRMAEYELEDDKAKEGLSGLEATIAAAPADDSTRIRLFNALMDLNWHHEAEKVLADLEARGKDVPAVRGARIRWVQTKGDRKQLQALFEKSLEEDRRALWVHEQRYQLALASGDYKVAKESLDEEEKASWDVEEGEFDLKRANFARVQGDASGEIDSLKKALDARPQDLDLRERLARAYAERSADGDDKRALTLLDDLLEVEPHRLAAQNVRTRLRGKVDEFWKDWEYDAREAVKTAPEPKDHPDSSVVCLQDQTVTRIRRDGSATEVVHELWKILDDDGKESMGKRPQQGDLMAVRVFTPEGEVLEPIRAGNTFEMPGLAIGTCIEHEFKLEHGARDFQYTNGPWYLRDPELGQPYKHSRWVVIAPKDMNLEAIEKNLEANHAKKTVVERGDEVVRIWETFDQERIEPEAHMPPKEEFLPWVKLYERRSLEEMAGMYVDQSLGRTYVTPSIQAKADELCGKLEGDTAKIKAIFAFVKEHCTRQGQGESAAQILAAKGGSKTTLVMALLDAAKVPYRYALAGSSPDIDDTTDWAHPEPFQFHTGLLRVLPRDGAAKWLYPDGPRYVPMDLLPTSLWGAPVIVCDGASGYLDVLPRGATSETGNVSRLELSLLEGGSAKARYEHVFVPMEAYGIKEQVKNLDPKQIDNFAAQLANRLFTGARVKGWETPRLEDPSVPFTIKVKLEAENVVRKQRNGDLTVQTGLEPTNLKKSFGGKATRRFDIVLRGWDVRRDTAVIDLGPYACSRLPGDVQQENKYGQYSLVFVREGSKIRIERTLTMFPNRVTPAEYKEFLAFLDKVDAAERRPLVVEPRAGTKEPSEDTLKPKKGKDKGKSEDDEDK